MVPDALIDLRHLDRTVDYGFVVIRYRNRKNIWRPSGIVGLGSIPKQEVNVDFDGISLITTCTNRKRIAATSVLTASYLSGSSQESLLEEWCTRLSQNGHAGKASAVYCGRAFREACRARDEVAGELWIISAGLGLIADHAMIPSYSLTITGSGSDNVRRKVKEHSFSPASWWGGITAHQGLINPIHQLILNNASKLFVFALSQNYACLVQDDILSLSDDHLSRIRLIGLALHPVLDSRLHRLVMPYDERLDGPGGTNVGTRSDFAQRAMRHFVTKVLSLSNSNDLQLHAHFVSKTLSGRTLRQIPKRKRLSDEEIMEVILRNWHSSPGNSSKMLRIIRDDEKIACEQSRFRELYRLAKEFKEKVSQ